MSDKLRVLLIGRGGREHALAWKISLSERLEQLYVAPGNTGTACLPRTTNVPIAESDIEELVRFAREKGIDLTIVGPEQPLVDGIVDRFQAEDLFIFGPAQAAAQIEGSKVFMKQFLDCHGIPTAGYNIFSSYEVAVRHVEGRQLYPCVIKADGVAVGKGVFLCYDRSQALRALHQLMVEKKCGLAGKRVIIEEFLDGPEVSVTALSDGEIVRMLPCAQDYKRIGDGDQGANTGGMGAVAPVPLVTTDLTNRIMHSIVKPIIDGLADEGTPFRGILYPGLVITKDGPQVLEINCRGGDPETQTLLALFETDLLDLCEAAANGELDTVKLHFRTGYAATVVLAAPGYPEAAQTGAPIEGLENFHDLSGDFKVFHAGVRQFGDQFVVGGGRVLNCVGVGKTLEAAIEQAYSFRERLHFPGMPYRTDIGCHAR